MRWPSSGNVGVELGTDPDLSVRCALGVCEQQTMEGHFPQQGPHFPEGSPGGL